MYRNDFYVNNKKILSMRKSVLVFALILSTIAVASAQTYGTGGVRRGGTSLDMRENMKERIKETLKISSSQTDSIAAVEQAYLFKLRAFKTDTNLTDSVRTARVSELEAERKQKFKAILTDEQIAQLDTLMKNRKMREQRQGQKVDPL